MLYTAVTNDWGETTYIPTTLGNVLLVIILAALLAAAVLFARMQMKKTAVAPTVSDGDHFYGVPKYPLKQKMFGIFRHHINVQGLPIFRGFDDEFFVPHSRHTEIHREDILKVKELALIAESDESGVYMAMARNGREFFITGHSEYSPYTLDTEYKRDLGKGLPIEMPVNYYKDDNPDNAPYPRWCVGADMPICCFLIG